MTESELVMRLNRLEGQVRQLTGRSSSCSTATASSSSSCARAAGRRAASAGAASAVRRAPPRRSRNMRRRRRRPIRRSRATRRKPIRRSRSIRSRRPTARAAACAAAAAAMRSIRTRTRMRRACRARSAVPARSRPRRRSTARTTSRPRSARPAAARPARRSISASWPRRPPIAAAAPGAPDSRRAAASAAAQSERHRRAADGDGADQHAEGRVRPRLRLRAAQGLCARRGRLRAFIKKYPNDRLVADANYWLGETLFQRQRYREAAESFLGVSTKYEKSAKAPDSLLRLGQSLAALKEKEAACATSASSRANIRAAPAQREAVGRARAEAHRLPLELSYLPIRFCDYCVIRLLARVMTVRVRDARLLARGSDHRGRSGCAVRRC